MCGFSEKTNWSGKGLTLQCDEFARSDAEEKEIEVVEFLNDEIVYGCCGCCDCPSLGFHMEEGMEAHGGATH